MNLDGTPGLIDRRGARNPITLERRPVIRIPKPPAAAPLSAMSASSPLILGMFPSVSADEPDGDLAPVAFVYAGLIILAMACSIVLLVWMIPSAHGVLPFWLKALAPMAVLAYGLHVAVQRGWIVRIHS